MSLSRIPLVACLVVFAVRYASAQVQSVQVNFTEDVVLANAQFNGTTLSVQYSSSVDRVTVIEDGGALAAFTNMSFSLVSTYDRAVDIQGSLFGKFRGGSFELAFEDASNAYELSGTVDTFLLKIEQTVGGMNPYTLMGGEGRLDVLTAILPANPTGNWPMSPDTWDFLNGVLFEFGEEFPSSYWLSPTPWTGSTTGEWIVLPNWLPEPSSLTLMLLGAIVLPRWKRKWSGLHAYNNAFPYTTGRCCPCPRGRHNRQGCLADLLYYSDTEHLNTYR